MEPRTVTIELAPLTAALLEARAEEEGVTLEELLLIHFQPSNGAMVAEPLLDTAYMAECAAEADPAVTLDQVRADLSKITHPLSEEVSRERDER